jgi:hypothetical protein
MNYDLSCPAGYHLHGVITFAPFTDRDLMNTCMWTVRTDLVGAELRLLIDKRYKMMKQL